ncbi:alpha/beta hydrolase [Vibrio splendidus]
MLNHTDMTKHNDPLTELGHQFNSPRLLPNRPNELRWLNHAKQLEVHTQYGTTITYSMGSSALPKVLLVHGWGGHPSMFFTLANTLIQNGLHVVMPVLLGHDHAYQMANKGFQAQLECLEQVDTLLGPFDHIIGHSIGGLLSALLLEKCESGTQSISLLAAPSSLTNAFVHFVEQLDTNLTPNLSQSLTNCYIQDNALSIKCVSPQIYKAQCRVFIAHGKQDHRFHYQQAESIYRSCGQLPSNKEIVLQDNTGHLGILYSRSVHQFICSFIRKKATTNHVM